MSSSGRVTLAEVLDLITVERLELAPGDILVLKAPGALSEDDAQQLHDRVSREMPRTPILVLDNSADVTVLRARP